MIYKILDRLDEFSEAGGVGYWLVTHPWVVFTVFGIVLTIYLIFVRVDEKEHRRKEKKNEQEQAEEKKVKYPSEK
jgi:uncharacterized membrane protein